MTNVLLVASPGPYSRQAACFGRGSAATRSLAHEAVASLASEAAAALVSEAVKSFALKVLLHFSRRHC